MTRSSVEAYNASYPAPADDGAGGTAGQLLVPAGDARRLLGLTRHEATWLGAVRQLGVVVRGRHQYVTLASALVFAPEPAMREALTAAATSS
ncbi:hypothetical protein GCM10023146_19630 [Nocardioides caricicola]